MPYQFSVNYWRNNKQFLTFLSFIIIVNIVLFVTRAYYFRDFSMLSGARPNPFYMISRANGKYIGSSNAKTYNQVHLLRYVCMAVVSVLSILAELQSADGGKYWISNCSKCFPCQRVEYCHYISGSKPATRRNQPVGIGRVCQALLLEHITGIWMMTFPWNSLLLTTYLVGNCYWYWLHFFLPFYMYLLGRCLNFNSMIILVLVLRYSITKLRELGLSKILPLDHNIYLHKVVGYLIFFQSLFHTVMHLLNFWINVQPDPYVL